jgi:uncharacterized membrane protein YjjP (DUF1212 family)
VDQDQATSAVNDEAEVLLQFGASMLAAGNTASRTHEWIDVLARKLDFDVVSVSLSFGSIVATFRRSGKVVTGMREIGPPGVNAWRIGELERVARTLKAQAAPHEIAAKLAQIETTSPLYSMVQIAGAVGIASAAFAFLNGAAMAEMIAAAVGGGVGQLLRSYLSRLQLNQYGIVAASAVAACGVYLLVAAIAGYLGFRLEYHSTGFIASTLFLIPGFPLIAALFDLLQNQVDAALGRLAYGVMLLLAVALGVGVVIEIAGIDLPAQAQLELAYPLKLLLRTMASFLAGAGFAILFNSSPRIVLAVGLLALAANGLRLGMSDMGMTLAPASFFAALIIGIAALMANRLFNVPRMAMAVAPTIIMVPGKYALEMIALFNRGHFKPRHHAFS